MRFCGIMCMAFIPFYLYFRLQWQTQKPHGNLFQKLGPRRGLPVLKFVWILVQQVQKTLLFVQFKVVRSQPFYMYYWRYTSMAHHTETQYPVIFKSWCMHLLIAGLDLASSARNYIQNPKSEGSKTARVINFDLQLA